MRKRILKGEKRLNGDEAEMHRKMGKCKCCGAFCADLEELNLDFTWRDLFCPSCAEALMHGKILDSAPPDEKALAKTVLALFVQQHADCLQEPIDVIEDNDGTVMNYFLWVERARKEDAVRIVDERSTEWGEAEDVGDVTLIECIEEGLHTAGIRYVIEEFPERESGILPIGDTGERYMLMEVSGREIAEPTFFRSIALARLAIVSRLASTLNSSYQHLSWWSHLSIKGILDEHGATCEKHGVDYEDLLFGLGILKDNVYNEWGIASDSNTAWADKANHNSVDWRIIPVDLSTI